MLVDSLYIMCNEFYKYQDMASDSILIFGWSKKYKFLSVENLCLFDHESDVERVFTYA